VLFSYLAIVPSSFHALCP